MIEVIQVSGEEINDSPVFSLCIESMDGEIKPIKGKWIIVNDCE